MTLQIDSTHDHTARVLINNEAIDYSIVTYMADGHVTIEITGLFKDYKYISELLRKCRWIVKIEITDLNTKKANIIHVKIWEMNGGLSGKIALMGHTEYLGDCSNT
jgi:hypothetical protein